MTDSLEPRERLQLLKFVCSFAWADLEVRPEERAFVARMVERLALGADERAQVRRWLERPPSPDSVDPMTVPREHRETFLEAIEGVIASDGEIAPEERESLALLRDLFGPPAEPGHGGA